MTSPANVDSYWLTQLSDIAPGATIFLDGQRPAKGRVEHAHHDVELDASSGTAETLFPLLTAAVALTVSRWTTGVALVIGTPARTTGSGDTFPLVVNCDPALPVSSFVDRVKDSIAQAYAHPIASMFDLALALGQEPSDTRSALFDLGIEVEGLHYPFDLAEYPVDALFQFKLTGGKLCAAIHYNVDIFRPDTIARVGSGLRNIYAALTTGARGTLADIDINAAGDRRQIVAMAKGETVSFPLGETFHALFDAQAKKTPEALAAVHNGAHISYRGLRERSNQIAHTLAKLSLANGEFVAIALPRGIDFLAAMLGIFKAGGAYVPVDPTYPPERITYMLQDSQVRFVVSDDATRAALPMLAEIKTVAHVIAPAEVMAASRDDVTVYGAGTDRAYMIYTSGSTGRPKGAICRHDGALNHLLGELHRLGIEGKFNFLQTAPSSSDISVWQFLAPVIRGGATIVADQTTVVDPERLFETIVVGRVNVAELVPVVLRELLDYVARLPKERRALPELKCMMATGDALPVEVVNKWFRLYPGIPLANTYGPTEASDDVTIFVMKAPLAKSRANVPIGAPLPNLSVFICDALMRLAPIGAPGEICVAGIGVGDGYWRDADKTAKAFVPNPIRELTGKTVYRTGDLGRLMPDGTIEFLGRIDQQVKVRGFRVEPGEIEAVLDRHPTIANSVVEAREDSYGNRRLVAYVVARTMGRPSLRELREYLKGTLADFMVPSAFVFLDAFPLTPVGKIDRKALPAIEDIAPER